MNAPRDLEKVLARILHLGAYGSFALVLLGTILMLGGVGPARVVILAGVLLLLTTPVVRVLAAVIMFARNREFKYVAISTIVLVVVLASVLVGARLD